VPIFQDDYVDTYAAHKERDGESNCPHGAQGMCMSRICQILWLCRETGVIIMPVRSQGLAFFASYKRDYIN
jgi:hypothetical protein